MVTQTNESGWHPDSFANRMAERGRKQMEEEAARERVRDAAPDLLEAARRLLMFARDVRRTEPISEEEEGFISLARAAIAKAEGRA